MTEQSTGHPLAVFRNLLDRITSGHWPAAADLYAPDCVVEQPFALPEPIRIVGREAVRQHFVAGAAGPISLRVTDPHFHLTADPEVVIGEFGYDVLVGTTAETFSVANIQVIRVRAGLIQDTRDYHDHARLAEAMARA